MTEWSLFTKQYRRGKKTDQMINGCFVNVSQEVMNAIEGN